MNMTLYTCERFPNINPPVSLTKKAMSRSCDSPGIK